MSSQSQPPIPPAAGLRGSPGSPDSANSAPSPDSGDDDQGVLTIQDTPVIDATGSGSSQSAGTSNVSGSSESVGTSSVSGSSQSVGTSKASGSSESVGVSDAGVPVEPIPPVSDPKDDPVVRAAEGEAAGRGDGDDPQRYSAGEHDADRVNDPRT